MPIIPPSLAPEAPLISPTPSNTPSTNFDTQISTPPQASSRRLLSWYSLRPDCEWNESNFERPRPDYSAPRRSLVIISRWVHRRESKYADRSIFSETKPFCQLNKNYLSVFLKKLRKHSFNIFCYIFTYIFIFSSYIIHHIWWKYNFKSLQPNILIYSQSNLTPKT